MDSRQHFVTCAKITSDRQSFFSRFSSGRLAVLQRHQTSAPFGNVISRLRLYFRIYNSINCHIVAHFLNILYLILIVICSMKPHNIDYASIFHTLIIFLYYIFDPVTDIQCCLHSNWVGNISAYIITVAWKLLCAAKVYALQICKLSCRKLKIQTLQWSENTIVIYCKLYQHDVDTVKIFVCACNADNVDETRQYVFNQNGINWIE